MSRWLILVLCTPLLACTGDDGGDEGADTEAGTADDTGGSTDSGAEDDGGAGGAVLGCPAGESCTLVLVSQTLDDRVEIFAPNEANAYRGAIDLDLKPNECDGCEPGDYNDGRLDEPFGIARGGGFLHVAVGHYPSRDEGSLFSFPLTMFESMAAGSTLAVGDYFSDGNLMDPVVGVQLGAVEPIFVTRRGARLLIGTFNNDLFATEDTWVNPGQVIVVDVADPGQTQGSIPLDGIGCNGATQVIDLGGNKLAVACDGNEKVALLDVGDLDAATPQDATTVEETLCDIPGAMVDRRVRYLAPDGEGGFLVAEGPTPLSLMSGTRLWHFDGECQMLGLSTLMGSGQIGEIEAMPNVPGAWLVASAGVLDPTMRGVLVVRNVGGALEVCQNLPGFEDAWTSTDGELEPFGLAVNSDGTGLAVGAGPFQAPTAGPGYGKVLWATLQGADDPCSMTASVADLTDGSAAPAVDAADPATYRRAPAVVELVEISG